VSYRTEMPKRAAPASVLFGEVLQQAKCRAIGEITSGTVLFVPNGHPMGHDGRPRVNDEGVARDSMLEIREVGRHGGPLPRGFLE
jgi:hypothetical protein